ncbi:MAG: Ig-like domain-containing protein, partial [Phormidesmis sp.]
GNYSVTPDAPLAEGTPALTVTTTDESGNESVPSEPLTLTIDETAPTAPATPTLDPTSDTGELGDNITGDTTPTVTGTGAPGETIKLYADGTEVGSTVVDDAGNYSVTPDAPLAEGTPALTVTTTDPSGNESAPSEPLTLTIDETAPTAPATPTLDPASDTGELGDNVTSETTPTLTGTGTPGETVTLYADDAPVGTAIVDDEGNYSITPDAPLAEGTPALTVTTTDPSGNESAPSEPLTLTIDETAPTAPAAPTLDPASDTGELGDNVTGETTPTLTGTGTPGETVTLYADDAPVGTAIVDDAGNYSVTPDAPLAEGTSALTVTTTDPSGNESAPSEPLTLTIDETAPSAPATPTLDPASDTGELGDNITGDTTPTVTGTGTPGETVTLYADDAPVGTAVVDDAGNYSVTPDAPLAEGTPALTVTTTDPGGNESAPSEQLTLTVDETAPTAPAAPTLDPASDTGELGDNITGETTPTLTGTGTPGEIVKLYADGTEVGTTVVDDEGNYSVTPDAPLAEGTPALTVTTTDESGNESVPSEPLTL